MNVVVCTKHVPNPQGTPTLGPDHLLVRSGVEGALDPGDEYGLELALQLVERHGGEVTAVSMGPDDALAAVQRALAMGAHRGVLVTDDVLRGADALVTARVLAAAIQRQPAELVIAGVESTDGYTGTVPVTVAALLGHPSVTAVRALELEGDALRVERQTESGYDVYACPTPALITVTAGATEPRYPSLKGIMQAKQKPLDRLTAADLGLAPEDLRSSQTVVEVVDAPPPPGGEIVEGDTAVGRIADLLADAGAI
ncbi:MAG TPA: electron transfer flavoprotein subunit beta/FixA family protein [Actinomycetota bacterium]|nr:electron transfer flavoprotein subunit beta/FixA family protein [Actinomycetota bacterium]